MVVKKKLRDEAAAQTKCVYVVKLNIFDRQGLESYIFCEDL